MQTFLPYPDLEKSAECLDRQRLNKQRSECITLLRALLGHAKGSAWVNHPAARMWDGHEGALAEYGIAICQEWSIRGYEDTVEASINFIIDSEPDLCYDLPAWFGDDRLHSSHRSNLLRKDWEHYSKFGWKEPPDLPYWWPK